MVMTRSMAAPDGRSRTYPSWLDTRENNIAMMPLVDFFNHHSNPTLSVTLAKKHVWDVTMLPLDEENRFMLQLTATNPVKKGDEIFFSYGAYSDLTLFTRYGFLMDSGTNPHTAIRITKEIVVSVGTGVVGSYADWDERNSLK